METLIQNLAHQTDCNRFLFHHLKGATVFIGNHFAVRKGKLFILMELQKMTENVVVTTQKVSTLFRQKGKTYVHVNQEMKTVRAS